MAHDPPADRRPRPSQTSEERAVTPEDLAAWRGYIGREETREQYLDRASLRRFAAAVGAPLDVETRPPPIAHWAFFQEIAPPEQLGPDGHPRRGEALIPPIHLSRRMFAAGAMRFIEPLTLEHPARLTLRMADLKHRSTAHGDLIFVEIDRLLIQDGRPRVSERQSIAYRRSGAPIAPVVPVTPVVPGAPVAPGARVEDLLAPASAADESWLPDSVQLFRFSAATFNAHRIHYDMPYAESEEGYPGLVVQGPLTAVKLCEFAGRRAASPLRTFDFRLQAPLFANQAVLLRQGAKPGSFEAVRCDGVIAVSANVS